MRRPAGLTLVETLVAAVLCVAVVGIFHQLVVPSLRWWADNQARAAMEQNGLVAQKKIAQDLERSTCKGVTVFPAGGPGTLQAFSFPVVAAPGEAESYDVQTGAPSFQAYVVYFVPDHQTTLYREVWRPAPGGLPLLPSAAPPALGTATLLDICEHPQDAVAVAGGVAQMAAVVTPPDSIRVTLDLSTRTPDGVASTERIQQFGFRM